MNEKRIEKYTKQLGVRFSRRQKNRFIQEISKDFEELDYSSHKIEGRKWLNNAKDIFFGNMKTIKTVIVVPYDTPEHKFWHKILYYPFDGNLTANKTMLATFIPVVALYAVILLFVFYGSKAITDVTLNNFISVLMFFLLLFLVYLMTHGIQNRKNYTRYSSSIAAALEIAEKLDRDERKRVGFLFTDKNKSRFLGSEIAMKEFREAGKNPTVIMLDCIGKGTHLEIGYKPQNRKLAAEIGKYDPEKDDINVVKIDENMQFQNSIAPFEKAVILANGSHDLEKRLYIRGTGTGKDNAVELDALQRVITMVCDYLHKLK